MPESVGRPLYDFAYIHNIDDRLDALAQIAEPENWKYRNSHNDRSLPVLYYYFHNTFERIQEQNKIALTEDGEFSCFNTGLVTTHQEPIYALFSKNSLPGMEPWRFVKFCRKGDYELTKFQELPDIATYFDDPSVLVFDSRADFRVSVEHIIGDNRERFPEPFKSMDDYALQTILNGAIENAKERVRRNYKVAVPQFYKGQVQLLIPICLSRRAVADVALIVQKQDGIYRGMTCLTLDMAYNNARQLARPDTEWLNP
jgi:hypothetical protein